MSVTVERLEASEEDAYTRFVGGHPVAMVYSSLRFRDLLVGLLGCRPIYGIARRADEVVGVFPLMLATGPRGGVLNSLPYFGSNGGPLAAADDTEVLSALARWYAEQAAGVAAATVIENPLLGPAEVAATIHRDRVSVVTPLPAPVDAKAELLRTIDSSARRNVLKAERSGVSVRIVGDDSGSLAHLAHLHRLSMRLNGGPAKSDTFFELLPAVLRPTVDYQVYLASADGEVVAALLVLFHHAVAEYYMPATLPQARPLQPMAAILAAAMVDAAERGCAHWNWGGSGVGNESLVRFKVKWGGAQTSYRYLTLLNDEAVAAAPAADLLHEYPGFYVRPFDAVPP